MLGVRVSKCCFGSGESRQRKLHDLAVVARGGGGLGGGLEHAGDARDVDDVERQGALADGFDAAVGVLVAEA